MSKELVSKRQQVIDLLTEGKYKEAMAISKYFVRDMPKDEVKQIARAFEMTHSASFYEQLGFNAEAEFAKAVATLKRVYLGGE